MKKYPRSVLLSIIEENAFTVSELSRRSGVSRRTIERCLEGQNLNLKSAAAIAKAIGVSTEELMGHPNTYRPATKTLPSTNTRDMLQKKFRKVMASIEDDDPIFRVLKILVETELQKIRKELRSDHLADAIERAKKK